MHTDRASHDGADTVVAAAKARSVPVVTARQMLDWLDGRNGSSFQNLSYGADQLSFTVARGAGSNGLEALLPRASSTGTLSSLKRAGVTVPTTLRTIKGVEYAAFDAQAGDYVADYAADGTAPTISDVAATPRADGTARISWTTDEPASSRVEYGIDGGPLGLSAQDGAQVTSHALELSGLQPSTTYRFLVRSTDGTGNPAASTERTFTTPSASLVDTTVADFGAGSGGGTAVTQTADGEVTLAPALGQEFSGGPLLPLDWQSSTWTPGGSTSVGAGALTADGIVAWASAPVTAGHALEFTATFSGQPFQHVGFGAVSSGSPFNDVPWAMVSTGNDGVLKARTAGQDTAIAGSGLTGQQHLFRIEWDATEVRYYVDGALKVTHTASIPGPMAVAASDYNAGGGTVTVDWVRMSPYASPGTFTSRVFDGGNGAQWQSLDATTTTPAGTSAAFETRSGESASPDGSWSSWQPVGAGGAIASPSARRLQYRATLTSSSPDATPAVARVAIGYSQGGPDTTPPVISALTATPDADGTATVTWTTDEPATSTVEYGIDGGPLDQSAGTPTPVTGHSVTLTGLQAGTTYAFRAVSTDGSSNTRTSATDTFTTAPAALVDTTTGDFGAGSGSGTSVGAIADGEVLLAPAVGAEFDGGALPADWTSAPWTGGLAGVAGGRLAVDGAAAWVSAPVSAGRTLEFDATFSGQTFQSAGFGAVSAGAPYNDAPWAQFGTGNNGVLKARTSLSGAGTDTEITGTDLTGQPHRFRIEWGASEVRYFVDGALKATHAVAIPGPMVAAFSDYGNGGGNVTAGWMRMSPFGSPGIFTSRVLDTQRPTGVDWLALQTTVDRPAGTEVVFETRAGASALPDAGWSVWQPVGAGGAIASPAGRYLQYRATLSTTDPGATPAIERVAVDYDLDPDTTAPTITGLQATPGPGGTATITWTTDEPASSDVVFGTAPGALTGSALDAQPVTTHSVALSGLDPGTTYHLRANSTDSAGNTATSPAPPAAPLTFTTPDASAGDALLSDLAGGTPDGTYVGETGLNGSGGVMLAPALGSEFDGGTLPPLWNSGAWDGSAPTAVGGQLLARGGWTTSPLTYGAGRTLSFAGSFSAGRFQHVGFDLGDFNNGPWAFFSTWDGRGGLFARSRVGGVSTDTPIALADPTAPHVFRIVWGADDVRFYVDGVLKATNPFAGAAPMRIALSDVDPGDGGPTLNWLRLTPHAAAGTFTSRVIDSGRASADWRTLTSDTDPAGGTITFETRTGASTDPQDGTWSPWASVGGDDAVPSPDGRRIQYRASFTRGGDADGTPLLRGVSISHREGVVSTPAPSTPDLAPASDTGSSGSDDVTADATPAFTGSAQSDATVRLFVDGVERGSGTATGGAWTITTTALSDGPHQITATATDADGRASSPSPALLIMVDTTAPETTIDDLSTSADTATVTFSSAGAAGFTCSLDGGATSACTSPKTYTGLADGQHTINVAATDLAGNTDETPDTRVLTIDTSDLPKTITQGGAAGFAAGVPLGTIVGGTDSGSGTAVLLAPAVGEEFGGGPLLPAGWLSHTWSGGGAAAVAGGRLTADGAVAWAATPLGAGRVLEFSATFSGQAFQSVGFGATSSPAPYNATPWAQFGTGANGVLKARTSASGAGTDTELAGLTGQSHLFRIEWDATEVRYFVDGLLKASHAVAISEPMLVSASDYTTGGGDVAVDWIRTSPYAAAGTYTSSVLDAERAGADWLTLDGLTTTPAGTSVSFETRTSNDGNTWSDWQPVNSPIASPNGRYLQYRALLGSFSDLLTPLLHQVSVTYVADKQAPDAPSVPDLSAASDTGASSADDLTSDATPTFTGTAEDGASVRLFVDGVERGSGTASGGAWSITSTELSDGPRSVTARASDAAGNQSAFSAGLSIVIDTVAPETTIESSEIVRANASFSFSSESDASLACSLDDAPFVACASPQAYTGLPDGAHAFRVQSTDEAGNIDPTPAQQSFATLANRAPLTGTVVIVPASPATTDTLTATPSGFSDPDGDTLTYAYPGSATAS